mgnify:CR=1 FL=1
MRKLISNITTLSPQNVSILVLGVAVLVWAVIWAVLFLDITRQQKGLVWKTFWLLVTSVPVAGGVLYSTAQLLSADWLGLLRWRKNDSVKSSRSAKL